MCECVIVLCYAKKSAKSSMPSPNYDSCPRLQGLSRPRRPAEAELEDWLEVPEEDVMDEVHLTGSQGAGSGRHDGRSGRAGRSFVVFMDNRFCADLIPVPIGHVMSRQEPFSPAFFPLLNSLKIWRKDRCSPARSLRRDRTVFRRVLGSTRTYH